MIDDEITEEIYILTKGNWSEEEAQNVYKKYKGYPDKLVVMQHYFKLFNIPFENSNQIKLPTLGQNKLLVKIINKAILNADQELLDQLRSMINEPQAEEFNDIVHIIKDYIQDEPSSIKRLLEKSIYVDVVNRLKRTPLYEVKDTHLFNQLIARGANIDHLDNLGHTPLMNFLSFNYNINFARALIEHNADVNLRTMNNESAFYMAAYQLSDPELTLMMLKKGFDIEQELVQIYKEVIAGDIITAYERVLAKVFILAVKENRQDICQLTEQVFHNPNLQDEEGQTPLMMAAKNHDDDLCLYLIEYGFSIKDLDVQMRNRLLTIAVQAQNYNALFKLITQGTDISLLSDKVKRDIMEYFASRKLNYKCSELVRAGMDIDLIDDVNTRFLTYVCMDDIAKCLEMIEQGANIEIRDSTNKTALSLAIYRNQHNLAMALIEKGANVNIIDQFKKSLLQKACDTSDKVLCLALLKKKADINHVDNNGSTALLDAIRSNKVEISKMLIEAGADVTYTMPDGASPLICAIKNGNVELVKMLLNIPKIMDNITADNNLALKHAVKHNQPHIVNLLLNVDAVKNLAHEDAFSKLPSYYDTYLKAMSQMIILGIQRDPVPEPKPQMANDFIYNYQGYSETKPVGTKGNPLEVMIDGVIYPIGYQISMPQNLSSMENVIVSVYGGGSFKDLGSVGPITTEIDLMFSQNNIPTIKLYLPDLRQNMSQFDMTPELQSIIHQCIDYFHRTVKNSPEQLSPFLETKGFKKTKYYLYGASFGGRTAIRHGQLYPKSFEGYISHDAGLSETINIPIHPGERKFQHPLDVLPIHHAEKTPNCLLLQNRDDNNVNILQGALNFYEKLEQAGKQENVRLVFFEQGSKAGETNSMLRNKGHSIPEDTTRYIDMIQNFMKYGPSKIPQWHAYSYLTQKRLAKQFFRDAPENERFLALASQKLYKNKLHKEDLRIYQKNKAEWDKNIWVNQYQPILQSLREIETMNKDDEYLKEFVDKLKEQNLLTEEVLKRAIEQHSPLFKELCEDIDKVNVLTNEDIYENPLLIEKFKALIFNLPNTNDFHVKSFILENLLFSNPQLLPALNVSKAWKAGELENVSLDYKNQFETQVKQSKKAARKTISRAFQLAWDNIKDLKEQDDSALESIQENQKDKPLTKTEVQPNKKKH